MIESSCTDRLIRTVAAVIANGRGEVLLVRKQASRVFIQPGGKIEPGEDRLSALARELDEELGVRLGTPGPIWLGQFEDAAINEPGWRVRTQAYRCSIRGTPAPCAEIAELAWVRPVGPYAVPVAPLSTNHVLPAYMSSMRG